MTGFFLFIIVSLFYFKIHRKKSNVCESGIYSRNFNFSLNSHFSKGVLFHVASSFEARKRETGSRTLVVVDNCTFWL